MKKQMLFVLLLTMMFQESALGRPGLSIVVKGPKGTVSNDPQVKKFQPIRSSDIGFGYRPDGGKSGENTLRNGAKLRSGDFYKIQFTPTQDCYVYIFQYDASHQLFTLFPTKDFDNADSQINDNPVKAGQTYFVPGKDKSFVLDEQVGEETIHFLVSQSPKPKLEKLYHRLLNSRLQKNSSTLQIAQNELLNSITNKGPKSKVEHDNQSATEITCSKEIYCVHSITFQHLP